MDYPPGTNAGSWWGILIRPCLLRQTKCVGGAWLLTTNGWLSHTLPGDHQMGFQRKRPVIIEKKYPKEKRGTTVGVKGIFQHPKKDLDHFFETLSIPKKQFYPQQPDGPGGQRAVHPAPRHRRCLPSKDFGTIQLFVQGAGRRHQFAFNRLYDHFFTKGTTNSGTIRP